MEINCSTWEHLKGLACFMLLALVLMPLLACFPVPGILVGLFIAEITNINPVSIFYPIFCLGLPFVGSCLFLIITASACEVHPFAFATEEVRKMKREGR